MIPVFLSRGDANNECALSAVPDDKRITEHAWCYFRYFRFTITHLCSNYDNNEMVFDIPKGFIATTSLSSPLSSRMFDSEMWSGFSWIDMDTEPELPMVHWDDAPFDENKSTVTRGFGWAGIWKNGTRFRLGVVSGLHMRVLDQFDELGISGMQHAARENRRRFFQDVDLVVHDTFFSNITNTDNDILFRSRISDSISFNSSTFALYEKRTPGLFPVFCNSEPTDVIVWRAHKVFARRIKGRQYRF